MMDMLSVVRRKDGRQEWLSASGCEAAGDPACICTRLV